MSGAKARARNREGVGFYIVYTYAAKHTPPTGEVSTLLYERVEKEKEAPGCGFYDRLRCTQPDAVGVRCSGAPHIQDRVGG